MRKIYNIAILVSGSITSQSTPALTLPDSCWTTDDPQKYDGFPGIKLSERKEFRELMSASRGLPSATEMHPSWNVQGPLNVPQHTQTTEEQFLKKSKWIETSGCGGTKMCHCGLFRKKVYNTPTLPFSHIEPSKVLVLLALLKACG